MDKRVMKAAVLENFHQPLQIREMPIPVPGSNEVLVQVMASGLCLTDTHIQDGIIASVRLPYIPGHEMAGVVVQIGENPVNASLVPGQHVVCGIDITCGRCTLCTSGRPNLCLERVRIGFERNGSHAEYALVPSENLFPIADHIPFDQACIIPDAVACMYHAIFTQGQVAQGSKVLIHGVGALGLQGVQLAKLAGATVYAAARTHAKLDQALRFGADQVIPTREKDLVASLDEMTQGEMCDVAFDLVGNADSLDLLLRCIRPGGKIIALAYAEDAFSVPCQELVIKEKEILGLRGSTPDELRASIRLVEEGKILPYVSSHFRLEEINQALDFLRAAKGIGRSVIMMGS